LKTLRLKGSVFSGTGEGSKYISLPWVKQQIREKLGFDPYVGTLNIKLTEDSVKHKKTILRKSSLEILPAAGFCRGKLFEARHASNAIVAVIVPEIPEYPEDVLEIISPENLRKKLQLRDGDTIEVEIIL